MNMPLGDFSSDGFQSLGAGSGPSRSVASQSMGFGPAALATEPLEVAAAPHNERLAPSLPATGRESEGVRSVTLPSSLVETVPRETSRDATAWRPSRLPEPRAALSSPVASPATATVLGRLADRSCGESLADHSHDWSGQPLDVLRQRAAGFADSDLFRRRQRLYERLAETGGQPRVMVIACSDCACDVGHFAGAEPGSLFVVRNAGNVVPPHGIVRSETAGAIDLALSRLPIEHIVVCGHSGCITLASLLEADTASPAADWLQHLSATADALHRTGLADDGDRLDWAGQHSVLVQLHHLATHPTIARRLAEGRLELHGWWFDTAAGELYAARSLAFTEDVRELFEPV